MRQEVKLIIAIILAVLSLVILQVGEKLPYFKLTKPTTSATDSILPPAQVSITSTGFVPATINIKTGQQVVWTNTTNSLHQIASDPHPTHTLLPGLDSLEPLKQNETYAFVFESIGTYTYHDHLNPLKFKGTIIVK